MKTTMAEKYQYGQKLSLHVKSVIKRVKTQHSEVQYIETFNHGNVLLMDDEIQLSTQDEYRYHETLVHPIMKSVSKIVSSPLNVLILGGGDGCAAREVFKWGNVASVTIVDYDSEFVNEFGKGHLAFLNKHVYSREKLTYVCSDALDFLSTTVNTYDVVFIDLPDPDSRELLAVYTTSILLLKNVLTPTGGIGMHVGPALLNPDHENWEMIANFRDLFLHIFSGRNPTVKLNTCYVPSFSNEWAFMNMIANPDFLQEEPWSGYLAVEDLCRYWRSACDYLVPLDIREIYRRRL